MAGDTMRFRNPAGHAGLLHTLVSLVNSLAGFVESRIALFAKESKTALVQADTLEKRLQNLPALAATLQGHPEISAAYVGYEDGEFFLVRRFDPDSYLARTLLAPKDAAYVVQSIDRDAEGLRQIESDGRRG